MKTMTGNNLEGEFIVVASAAVGAGAKTFK
jgi:hypothetical protein